MRNLPSSATNLLAMYFCFLNNKSIRLSCFLYVCFSFWVNSNFKLCFIAIMLSYICFISLYLCLILSWKLLQFACVLFTVLNQRSFLWCVFQHCCCWPLSSSKSINLHVTSKTAGIRIIQIMILLRVYGTEYWMD